MDKKVLELVQHAHNEIHISMFSLAKMVLMNEIDVDEDLQKVNEIIGKVNDLLTDAEILCIEKCNENKRA